MVSSEQVPECSNWGHSSLCILDIHLVHLGAGHSSTCIACCPFGAGGIHLRAGGIHLRALWALYCGLFSLLAIIVSGICINNPASADRSEGILY